MTSAGLAASRLLRAHRPVSGTAAVAVGLVVLETVLSKAFGSFAAGPFLLLIACGLAFVPFVPAELRRPCLVVPLVSVLSVAIASLALVSASSLGVPLTATSIRGIALLLTLVSAGVSALPAFRRERSRRWDGDVRIELAVLLLLTAILVLASTLYDPVVGGAPVPGEDWGHYLLYAQQIAREHAIRIDNPYWMGGGLAFSQDPGVPPLYGAFLLVGGQSAGVLVHGIVLFSLLGILAVFVFTAGLWGSKAGLVAAGLWAVLPAGLDLLSWHGLASVYALALYPLAALCIGAVHRGRLGWRWALLLALTGVSLLGAHRMTALVAGVTLTPVLALAIFHRPKPGARFLAAVALFGLVLGGGLVLHLIRLLEKTGQVSDYRLFLVRKVQWSYSVRDLTWTVIALGLVGLAALIAHPRTRRDPALLVLVGMIAGPVALGYAWLVHIPLDYIRMGTYLALPLVAACGAAWGRLLPQRALPLVIVPILLVAGRAHDLGPQFRSFYQIADPVTLRGLASLDVRTRTSTAPIVTDQCWAFLVPWLLQHRSLAGLEDWTIPFRQDLEPARRARRILYGGASGRALARRLGIRYVVLDPKCSSWSTQDLPVTIRGKPLYASNRLLILQLPSSTKS